MTSSAGDSPITTPDPNAAIRQWFELLGGYCAAVDFDTAEAIFADDVWSFGTRAAVVSGRGPLRANQWSGIWPNIRDFAFEMENLVSGGDENLAWGMTTWTSTGFDEQGESYFRPGRATIVMERRDGRWVVIHTHFSLAPGTPQRTFGPK